MLPRRKAIDTATTPFAGKDEVILESLSEGVCHIDPVGKIAYANPSAERMLGRESGELLGKDYPEVFFAKSEKSFSADKEFCPIHFTIETGETSHVNKDTFYTKENRELPVEYMCVSLSSEGKSDGAVISFQDIAERYEAELALSDARDAALEAARMKSAFLANMSHEIRTPLNGIVGTTDLLIESGLSEEQKHFAKMLKTSTELLRHIVNDVLDFSKAEAERFGLENIDFDISKLVIETLDPFKTVAAEKELSINAVIGESVPEFVRADANKIRQILNNLLSNAMKFTSEGEISVEVSSSSTERKSTMLQIAVSDTGIGIEEELQSRLFQPFEQADASTTRIYGGTGLGLAISKKFVELMNGDIGFESKEGAGSKFWFTLEAEVLTEAQISQSNVDSCVVVQSNIENSDLSILVVEDNYINREITAKMIEQVGLSAKCVENGAEALEVISNEKFDLIFMDCQMPVMDGFEATRKIRKNLSETDQPKIVALTASSAIEDSIKCLEAGMDDYLSKPFTKKDLASLISSYFEFKSSSKNLDLNGDIIQHSLTDIIKPSTLENFKEIESNGDKQFTKEILVLFAKHTEDQLDEIWVALSNDDFEGILQIAHKLKGSSASVGAEILQERFEEMERAVEQKKIEAIEEQIRLAFIEFKEAKNVILEL